MQTQQMITEEPYVETDSPDVLQLQSTSSHSDIANEFVFCRDLQKLHSEICTPEESRHARIFLVITGILTEIIQELMEYSGTSSQALYNKIVADKFFTKTLSNMDWQRVKTLHDPSKRYKELDISLMYTIIKHYKNWFVDSPTRNWGSNPQGNEVSIGDDVERIHRARNDYLHQISTKVTEQKLTEFFDTFINVGKRVDAYMNKTTELSYAKKIQNFKTCYLDDRMAREAIESSRIVESNQAWFVAPTAGNSNAVHVYRGIELTKYIEERKELPDTEKTPLLCIFPDIKNDDAKTNVRILNEYRDEINAGLISIKFEKADVGSIILRLEIENKVLQDDPTFEQELKILICNVAKYLKVDCTDMFYMIVTMTEGWRICDDDTDSGSDEESNIANSLILTINVENSILQSSDAFQQKMKHFFQVVSSKTNESYDGSAVISPIKKGIRSHDVVIVEHSWLLKH